MPAPISFRDEIDALMVTGAPMNENQATPVVTNEQELFERIADKCDALNDSYNALDENKANRGEVFSKDEVDAMPTDGSNNLVTSGSIAKSFGQLSPRWGVSAEKTVLTFSSAAASITPASVPSGHTYLQKKGVRLNVIGRMMTRISSTAYFR